MVSSELETANAVSQTIGIPAAQADRRLRRRPGADRRVRRPAGGSARGSDRHPADRGRRARRAGRVGRGYEQVVGLPLQEATIPADSKVASIIRGDRMIVPRGDESIMPGDRIVVIGSPGRGARMGPDHGARRAARRRRRHLRRRARPGSPSPACCSSRASACALIEASEERAREVAEELPDARVYNATGVDPDFLERERIGQAQRGGVRHARGLEEPLRGDAREGARHRLHDRDRPRPGLDRGLRAGGDRRRRQPALGHGGGDRPLRPRPAHPPARDAGGRPLRDPRHHGAGDEQARAHAVQGAADDRLADRRDRARRRRRSSRTATTSSSPATARSSSPSRAAWPRSRRPCESPARVACGASWASTSARPSTSSGRSSSTSRSRSSSRSRSRSAFRDRPGRSSRPGAITGGRRAGPRAVHAGEGARRGRARASSSSR